MEHVCFFVILLIANLCISLKENNSIAESVAVLNQTASAYSVGVHMGIINPEKYPLESFEQDERNVFKDSYKVYISLNVSEPINYEEWLIMNNFGILPDTQESLFQKKLITRGKRINFKKKFMECVKKGDILITAEGDGPFASHAAIMISNDWVLDMAGGKDWKNGIPDNNRIMLKDRWFDLYDMVWTTVYGSPYKDFASDAAIWAYVYYYNPEGCTQKTIHVTYKVTKDFYTTNPSYPGKLVLQAYYFSTHSVRRDAPDLKPYVLPVNIPLYFYAPYSLINKGKY